MTEEKECTKEDSDRLRKIHCVNRINCAIVNYLVETNKDFLRIALCLSEEEFYNLWKPSSPDFFTLKKFQEMEKIIFGRED